MHLFSTSTRLLLAASCIFHSVTCRDQNSEQTVTIYSWPLASASPSELARIGYNVQRNSSAMFKYTPPSNAQDLVRVGLYDPKTSEWTGVVTAASSFGKEYQQKIELHVDDESQVWHVGFAARPMPNPPVIKAANGNKSKRDEVVEVPQVVVEIVQPTPGPKPHLNQPVLLSPEGKVQEAEPEKTFLQKYWWAIALFVLVQVVMAGGGGAADK